jgi:hypothetical protein
VSLDITTEQLATEAGVEVGEVHGIATELTEVAVGPEDGRGGPVTWISWHR